MRKIELFEEELELYKKVEGFNLNNSFFERQDSLNALKELTKILLNRGAISENRVKYFIDKNYQTGRTTKSRFEVFKSKGLSKAEIFKDPHFRKYLLFFINGANIPEVVEEKAIRIFEDIIYHDDGIQELFAFIKSRKYIPAANDARNEFAEEMFKLTVDLKCELHECFNLRGKIINSR
jgi:hypothetical protein